MTKKYDVFISHAGEDKATLVRPLAEALRAFGVSVWYDEFTLSVGDSLSRSIDHGLADSNFGLVILSPDFLRKGWPEYELRGLTAREVGGRKVILPIWHNLDREELMSYSPPLADKIALRYEDATIPKLACAVIDVVRPDLFEKIQRRAAYLSSRGETKTLKAQEVHFPPPRHERLPLNLVSRIRLIRAALIGVYTHSMQFWTDGFRGDAHPSREIRIWEHVAACYLEYCAMTPLTRDQRKTVFNVVSQMSCNQDHETLVAAAESLPPDGLQQLQLLWQHAVPAFDVEDQPFPFEYSMSEEDQKRLREGDRESFPFDVPDELIADLIHIEEDDEDAQPTPAGDGLKAASEE